MIPHKPFLVVALGLASVTGVRLLDSNASPVAPPNPPRGGATWEISVTNLTRGQIFSPPVVAIHRARMTPLWTLGSKASPELAGVAEDALNPALIARLRADPDVGTVAEIKGKNGVILPGETATVRIRGGYSHRFNFNRVSMAGMLVITNDAFFGLDGVAAPFHGTKTVLSPAYDAGSEANNEDCDYIPGPPCNNPMMRATKDAEGYVHIHAGIHGIEDLKPHVHDWRGDVAQIRIRRVR